MATDPIPAITLNQGGVIPQLGFGVFKVDPAVTQQTVEAALAAGYRHIDTATGYNNESEVGAALKAAGLPREQVWVTTKLRNDHHAAGDVRGAMERSLMMLGLDYVDLYLIHWPMPKLGLYVATWQQLEQFKAEGLARNVGVANFQVAHLEALAERSGLVPALDQVELHPLFQQRELRSYLDRHGIAVEAWGPLGQGRFALDGLPAIADAARAHGKTPAQVILRWHLQSGFIVIPKAVDPAHMADNIAIFDFTLTPAEMAAIDALDTGQRLSADPDEVN